MNDNDGPEVVIAEKSSDDLKCPHCEHVLAGGEVFCPNCLQRLKDVGEEVQEERLTYEDAIVRAHPRSHRLSSGWLSCFCWHWHSSWSGMGGSVRPRSTIWTRVTSCITAGLYEESLDFYQQALEQDPELHGPICKRDWCTIAWLVTKTQSGRSSVR